MKFSNKTPTAVNYIDGKAKISVSGFSGGKGKIHAKLNNVSHRDTVNFDSQTAIKKAASGLAKFLGVETDQMVDSLNFISNDIRERLDNEGLRPISEVIKDPGRKPIHPFKDWVDGKLWFGFTFLDYAGDEVITRHLLINSDGDYYDTHTDEWANSGYTLLTNPVHYPINRAPVRMLESVLNNRAPTVNPTILYAKIINEYKKAVHYKDPIYHIVNAIYDIYTYCDSPFPHLSYLHFHGPSASGKTQQTMAVHQALVFNPLSSSNASVSSLYDGIELWQTTALCNDFEDISGEPDETQRAIWQRDSETFEKRQFFLTGDVRAFAQKMRTKITSDRDRTIELIRSDAPKTMSSIAHLDRTLGSRFIEIPHVQKPDNFFAAPVLLSDKKWSVYREWLYIFSMRHIHEIRQEYAELPDIEFEGRLFDITRPLLAIALVIDDYIIKDLERVTHQNGEEVNTENVLELLGQDGLTNDKEDLGHLANIDMLPSVALFKVAEIQSKQVFSGYEKELSSLVDSVVGGESDYYSLQEIWEAACEMDTEIPASWKRSKVNISRALKSSGKYAYKRIGSLLHFRLKPSVVVLGEKTKERQEDGVSKLRVALRSHHSMLPPEEMYGDD